MVGEQILRQIDRFLDEAEAAADSEDWPRVVERAERALAINSENEDALAFIAMAPGRDAASERGPSSSESVVEALEPAPSHPSSFVAGRYRVERFLGEGGRKRVFLAHDTTLDRDVAFAQIRTEGASLLRMSSLTARFRRSLGHSRTSFVEQEPEIRAVTYSC